MLNILVDEFPVNLEIDGEVYVINTDFRYSLSTLLAFEDPDLTGYEKTSIMLQNLYGENIPPNTEEALIKCQWFLDCGSDPPEDSKSQRRLFSWTHDGAFIFAAFNATHGIDLQTVQMHWWKFLALFMDLGQDTTFCGLTALRKRYYAGKCTKEERAMIQDMGEVFDVPDDQMYSLEEQEIISKLKENYRKAKEKRNGNRV